jgi:LacI family transcriptional regulator
MTIRRKPCGSCRVFLLIATWHQYGRGLVEGIWQYVQKHDPWLLDMHPSEPDESTHMPRGWQGDGIIAAIHTPEVGVAIRRHRVPVVNVSGTRLPKVNFPRVTSDAMEVMRMAVHDLRDRGFKTVAFCGEPDRHFIDFWKDAYHAVMKEDGSVPVVYAPIDGVSSQSDLWVQQKDRQRWLEDLPKPVGVIGWATGICRYLAMASTESGIHVPEDVAILSLETEDLLGKVVHPPISGVDIPVERIGYEAARQLDLLLQGRPLEKKEIFLPPLGVTTRQSSDVFAVNDPGLQEALRFIREQACTGIDVTDVLQAVPMARRTLERRFQTLLGHSPAEEIRRTKIEKVRQMLTTTNVPIPDIAARCGFNYVEHLIPIFKRYYGWTPSVYRRRIRPVR